MTDDAPPQDEAHDDEFTTVAAAEAERRLPRRQAPLETDIVVVKFSADGLVLELHGDDVDLGTDLKVRHEHRLIAEFRRDAVDGWVVQVRRLARSPPRRGTPPRIPL